MNKRVIKKQLRAIYDATEIERYYPPILCEDDEGGWWYEDDPDDPIVHRAKPVSGKRIKWLSHMIMRFGTPYVCDDFWFNSHNCRRDRKYKFWCEESHTGNGWYTLYIQRVKPVKTYEEWLYLHSCASREGQTEQKKPDGSVSVG